MVNLAQVDLGGGRFSFSSHLLEGILSFWKARHFSLNQRYCKKINNFHAVNHAIYCIIFYEV